MEGLTGDTGEDRLFGLHRLCVALFHLQFFLCRDIYLHLQSYFRFVTKSMLLAQ